MKRIKQLAIYYSVLLFTVASCNFEDLGKLEVDPIADLIVDTTGIPLRHIIPSGDELVISPIVSREGVDASNLSYEWWITAMPGADFSLRHVIGTEKELRAVIDNLTPTADFYSLWYRVTDNTTKLMRGIVFQVVVEPPMNQGLIVADSDDGINSDLSLIQDTIFTNGWVNAAGVPRSTEYRRNEFSRVHSRKFTGIIHSLFAQRLYQDRIYRNFLHGASRTSAFRMNTFDYSLVLEGSQLFYDPLITMNIDYYFLNGASQAIMMNAGKMSNRAIEGISTPRPQKFGITLPGPSRANRKIAVHPTTASQAVWYDEGLGKFLRLSTSINVRNAPLEAGAETTPFAPQNLPGYQVLGGGVGNLTEIRFVLKKDNYYGVFTLTNNVASSPRRQLDISNAPNIEQAISFVFPIDQAVIYYATPNKVYSIRIPQGGSVVYTDLYTSSDPITDLQMMRRSGNVAVAHTERCLLAITYNGSEGKVTTLPIPSSGLDLGLIDLSRSATFGGFKRISAVAIQE